MTDFNNTKRTPLDEQLDAALAKYSDVEPRPGFEERVLATMQAHERTTAKVSWWQWAGAAAVALLITTLLVWKLQEHGQKQIVSHPANPQQEAGQPRVAVKETPINRDRPPIRLAARRPHKHAPSAPLLASAEPKLDQFPSPQPLTKEEKMLLDYVGRYHDEAVVIARVQEEQWEQNQRDAESGKSR